MFFGSIPAGWAENRLAHRSLEHLHLTGREVRGEMLTEDPPRLLIRGPDLWAVPILRGLEHALKGEGADLLTRPNHERNIMGPDFQHRLDAAKPAVLAEPESRIEKPRIMGA